MSSDWIDWIGVLSATLLDAMLALQLALRLPGLTTRLRGSRRLMALGLGGYIVSATLVMTACGLAGLPAALSLVMQHSHFGHMQWLALAGMACLMLSDKLPRLAWPGLGLLLWSRAATGHAASAGMLSLPVTIHMGHLLGMALWLGPVLLAAHCAAPQGVQAARQARRLSVLASWALGILAVSGVMNLLRVTDGIPAHANPEYLTWLGIKLALATVAILLGAMNRWQYLPAIEQHVTHAVTRFWTILRLESAVLVLLLLCATRLSTTMPN
ncbi:hypothetical protein THUN1379_22030 [Paludibacterium sp. THUN1379]|uniref:copper resistance D family protein n=1 Tax=Paludibacterium sp. THUN1379 TaxID=3112107 RepID=UPI00308C16CF|nr:hypothetical protein THUN1379_22030 [Paludibacterium sp. THUN1379]